MTTPAKLATAAPAVAARRHAFLVQPRWTGRRCRSTCPTCGSDAPARSMSVAGALSPNGCAPTRGRPARRHACPMMHQITAAVDRRYGLRAVAEHRPRPDDGPSDDMPRSLPRHRWASGADKYGDPVPHRDLTGAPIQVAEPQVGGLGAAQSQPRQHDQDRVVRADRPPWPGCRTPIAAPPPRHLRPRQRGQSPTRHPRNRLRQPYRRVSGRVQKPQQRSQRRRHHLRPISTLRSGRSPTMNEVTCPESSCRTAQDSTGSGNESQKRAGLVAVAAHCLPRQPPLGRQPRRKPAEGARHRR